MNTQIYEEASAWVVDFRTEEPDAAARRRFERWLGTSPEHVRAYLELVMLWENAGASVDSGRKLDVDALIAGARAETNVIALQSVPGASSSPRSVRRRFRSYGIAAAVLVMLFTGGVAAWLGFYREPVYVTDVGEQRSIRLDDGSTVELNALSKIRVRFSEQERRIDLISGQALFRVAKVANRPFTVDSGQTRVRAVGTQFDVYRKRSGTVVTVLEGRVAIVPDSSAPASPVELAAGQQATVTAAAVVRPENINAATVTAWAQHPLVFESAPLVEVADEFNRYNTQRLVVEGSGLEDFHISGTFPANDPATLPRFVRFLREQPGVLVTESADRILVRKK